MFFPTSTHTVSAKTKLSECYLTVSMHVTNLWTLQQSLEMPFTAQVQLSESPSGTAVHAHMPVEVKEVPKFDTIGNLKLVVRNISIPFQAVKKLT